MHFDLISDKGTQMIVDIHVVTGEAKSFTYHLGNRFRSKRNYKVSRESLSPESMQEISPSCVLFV